MYNLWYFVAFYTVLLENLFFLGRFTSFCVEKNLAKNSARGEKMTNMRYGLAVVHLTRNLSCSKLTKCSAILSSLLKNDVNLDSFDIDNIELFERSFLSMMSNFELTEGWYCIYPIKTCISQFF